MDRKGFFKKMFIGAGVAIAAALSKMGTGFADIPPMPMTPTPKITSQKDINLQDLSPEVRKIMPEPVLDVPLNDGVIYDNIIVAGDGVTCELNDNILTINVNGDDIRQYQVIGSANTGKLKSCVRIELKDDTLFVTHLPEKIDTVVAVGEY